MDSKASVRLRTNVLVFTTVVLAAGGATYAMTRTLGPPVEASAWASVAWVGAVTLFLFDRKFPALVLAGVAMIASLNWLALVVRCG